MLIQTFKVHLNYRRRRLSSSDCKLTIVFTLAKKILLNYIRTRLVVNPIENLYSREILDFVEAAQDRVKL
jgi:hypothetical protein